MFLSTAISTLRWCPALVFFAAFIHTMPAFAEALLWKCGDTFTDQPTDKSKRHCVKVGLSVRSSKSSANLKHSANSQSLPKKNGKPLDAIRSIDQSHRKEDAQLILEAELTSTIARRDTLLATVSKSKTPSDPKIEPSPALNNLATPSKMLLRVESDIDALRRELLRLRTPDR